MGNLARTRASRLRLLALGCIAAVATAIPARPYGQQSWRRVARAGDRAPAGRQGGGGLTSWTTARLDHFSVDPRTFQQRYFVNTSVWKPGGPVFLCVGGEGPPLDEDVVVSGGLHCGLMVTLAVRHSALIVALEHRYYGQSQPFSDLATENLRFLSSRQALQDIAEFHAHVEATYSLPASTKWITFGGSYPGMLAAWARSKFPHLFHAAVSSSSPVEAILNMQGYNDVTASSLADTLVGGSPECLDAVRTGFASLGKAIGTPAGRRQVETAFNVCGPASSPPILEDPRSRALLTEGAADPLIPQSNDPACTEPVCDIRRQCELLTNQTLGTPLQRLQELNRIARAGECLNANYFEMLDELKDEKLAQDRTDRVWFYQTCSEFAFYQTCDPGSECPFVWHPHLNTLESYTSLCKLVFDIDPSTVAELVNQTNINYGGRDISATRIVWINGVIDPWRAQAVTKTNDPVARPSIIVPGASHHFWTHPAKPTDSAFVVKARVQIGNFVASALTEPKDPVLNANTGVDAHGLKGKAKASRQDDKRTANKVGQGKGAQPASFMEDNKRLPGVPLAPFQVVETD